MEWIPLRRRIHWRPLERESMSDLKVIIADRLRQCRITRGWKQQEAADHLSALAHTDISLSRYSNWENAIRAPKQPMIIKLSELYEVSPSWLQGYSANDSESILTANYLTANALHIVTGSGENLPVMQTSNDMAFHVDYLQKRGLNRNRILSIYQLDTSMEPLINKGDSLLIDQTATQVKGRDLFALVVGQDIWVRWITHQLNNTYVLTAEDSKSYPEQVLTTEQFKKLDIVGRVSHIGHSR